MVNHKNKYCIVIAGPTATGKSKVALHLAQDLGGEIINADSMQIYRYLDIGTAKPNPVERKKIPHHLFDIVNPDIFFSAADYQEYATRIIKEVRKRGNTPILVGGTGLYIKAVTGGFVFLGDKPDKDLREKLLNEGKSKGTFILYDRLRNIDPRAAERIHPHDLRRICRALEFYQVTGKPISRQWELTKRKQHFPHVMFGLYMPRELLYERINKRVDEMIRAGFLDEVKNLQKKGYTLQHKPLQSLGYRHMLKYLEGKYSFEEAVELMKRDTRRYAKRQLTWFKKEKDITWIEVKPDNLKDTTKRICTVLEG